MFFIHRNYFLRRMPQGKIIFQQLFLLSRIQIDTQSSLMGYRQLREIQIQVGQLVALGTIDTRIGWHQVPKQVMGDETPRNKMIQIIHTFLQQVSGIRTSDLHTTFYGRIPKFMLRG